MTYQVGMRLPPAEPRRMLCNTEIEPTWLIVEVRGGIEYKVRDKFAEFGIRSFFPGRIHVFHRNGRRQSKERATVTGYLFMHLDRLPNVDVMRERVPGFYRVCTSQGRFITVAPAKIQELNGMTAEESALEERRRDAVRVRVGDTATILEGALKGYTVDVKSIHNGEAIIALAFGGKVKADLASLARVIPTGEML
jgi:transcription antitermination factor NusG